MVSNRWFASGQTKLRWVFNSPIFVLLGIAVIEFIDRFLFHIPSPAPILLLIVLYLALHSTRWVTLISTLMVWAYLIYFFALSPQSVHYVSEHIPRDIIWSFTLPIVVMMVLWLRSQLDQEIAECKQQDSKFRALLESAPDAMVIVNEQGNIQLVNAQAEKLFGYTRAELIGSSVERLIPPSSRDIHTQHRETYKGNAQLRLMGAGIELYGVHKDGHQFPVEISLSPIETEDGRFICSAVRDVSAYRQAEEALRQSEANFRAVFEQAAVGITHSDADGKWLRFNQKFCDIVGYSREELDSMPWQAITHPDDFYQHGDDDQKLLKGEIASYSMEKRYIHKDGHTVWANLTVSVVRAIPGTMPYFSVIVEDITQRKQAEESLQLQARIAQNLSEGVALTRVKDGVLVYTNPVFESMFGYGAGELVGQPISIINAPGEKNPQTVSDEIMQTLAEKGSWKGEIENIRKDGTRVWSRVSILTFTHSTYGQIGVSVQEDITERKRIEADLLEERKLLKILMDNIPDAIYFKDRQSRFVRINRYHARMLGFTSPEEAYGKSDFDVHSAEFAQYTRASEQRIMESGEPIIDQVEFDTAFKDGPCWFSVTKVPHYDHTGQVVGIIGISRNITERKQIDDLLRTQEEFLRQIIDNAPNMIFVKDWDGRFLLVNKAFAQFNGVIAEQAIGKTDLALGTDKKQVEGFLRDDREVMTSRSSKLIPQEAVNNAQGETHWFQTIKVPLIGADGKSNRVLGVATDITERKEAEAALESQHSLLLTLIENIPDLIDVKDTESRFIIANPPVLQLLGVSKLDDLIGKSDFDFLPAEQARRWYDIEQSIIQSGESIMNVEEQVVSQSTGQIRWLLVTKVPLRDGNGKVNGIITINRDITDRKQAENALIKSEERYRIISEMISDYAFSFWVKPDGSLELDWITEESFSRLSGYSAAEVRDAGQFMFELDDHPDIEKERRETIQGISTNNEHALITKDGMKRWIHIYRQPVWNEDHTRVIQVYGVAKDVTERKEAEAALIESEERYRKISEMISDYAFSFSIKPDGSAELDWITEESFKRVTGYTPEDVQRGSWFMFDLPDQKPIQLEWERTIRGEATDAEHVLITKDGRRRWLHIYRQPVWNEDHTRVIQVYGVSRDVTERKEAEKALMESEERYRMISEMISDYAFGARVGSDGKVVVNWVAGSITAITGYTQDDFLDGSRNFILYHPDHVGQARSDVEKVLQGNTVDTEYQIVSKSGEVLWVRMIRRPVWDEAHEQVIGLYAGVQNITERKRAEEALHLSEERHRIISAIISDYASAFRVEKDGTIVLEWSTGSVNRVTGYTMDEYEATIGSGIYRDDETFAEYHPDDRDRVKADVSKTLSGIRTDGEYRMFRKNGDIYWVHVYRYPVWDETEQRVVRYYSVDQDITERKEAEEALRRSEERYRIISEMVTDNVFSLQVNPDGSLRQEWVMGSFTKLTGYGEAEIGTTYKLYHPDDAARAAADVKAVIAGQAASGEYRIIPHEGETLWVEIRRFPIWDEREKRVVRFIGAARDITARKQAEAQQLAMRLQSEKLAIARNFLGEVSHDFRTPLSIMKTSLYLVKKSPDPDKRSHHIDTLDSQITHIQRLLEDIFTLTRLDLGAAEFEFGSCNINSVMKDLYAQYQTRAAQNQCEIVLNLDPNLPFVRADRGELMSALRHLMTNALSYTPPGGTIRLETHLNDDCVRIEIRDSGIGINEEDRQHIFERFYRADKARGINTGGTGLGLSIVQRIIEAHNGRVEVESEVGEGSTFSILLPLLIAAPAMD